MYLVNALIYAYRKFTELISHWNVLFEAIRNVVTHIWLRINYLFFPLRWELFLHQQRNYAVGAKTRTTNYTPSFTLIQRDGVPGLLYGESRKRSLCRTLQMAFNVISPSLWFLKETHSVIPCMIPCMVPFLSSPYLPLLRWFFWHGAPISLNSSLLEVRECILISLLQPSTVVKLKRDLIQLAWFPIKSAPKVKCIWVSGREKEVLGAVWFWRITQCLLKESSAVLCISTISFCHLRLHSLYGTVPFGYR